MSPVKKAYEFNYKMILKKSPLPTRNNSFIFCSGIAKIIQANRGKPKYGALPIGRRNAF